MRFFDSHAHLDMTDTEQGGKPSKSVDDLIAGAAAGGVCGIVAMAGATSPGNFHETLAIAEKHDWIWAAAGIHPHAATEAGEGNLDALKRALAHPRVLALGEIGLDYHYNFSPPETQREVFRTQLDLARDAGLPVVIHTREAEADTLRILKERFTDGPGGVIHCFTATGAFADEALALGFYISFSGIVTFPKVGDIRDVAARVPDNRILAETDTPFLSPVPFRGRPNEPARVRHVVETLAEIRGVPPEEMAELTIDNTRRCFGINDAV
jgi:TatD DNase family protein